MDGGQGLRWVVRGAAHSNTQEKRDKSRDDFLGNRESTGGRGVEARQERQKT